VKTISQRELRNDNARVIRDVERGEAFIVTRHGVPVARLAPYAEDSVPRVLRPAKRRFDPSRIRRVTSSRATAEVLDELRGER
jgi:prevent-host-death family protein